MQRAKQHDAGLLDVEIDGAGKSDSFVELGLCRSLGAIRASGGAPQHWLDNERTAGRRAAAR